MKVIIAVPHSVILEREAEYKRCSQEKAVRKW
jgi:hypothetical protein